MTWATAAAAAIGGPASAQPPGADIFCAELARIVEAAAEDEPFASLERSAAPPPRLGFPSGCGADGAGRHRTWLCSQRLAPDTLSIHSLAARTAACLPQAEHVIFATWQVTMFRLPRAIIHIREGGTPGGHVGRIVSFTVEAIGVPASRAAPQEAGAKAQAGSSTRPDSRTGSGRASGRSLRRDGAGGGARGFVPAADPRRAAELVGIGRHVSRHLRMECEHAFRLGVHLGFLCDRIAPERLRARPVRRNRIEAVRTCRFD